MGFTDEEGIRACQISRMVVDGSVRGERLETPEHPESFREKAGAFTTLSMYPNRELRGCIGIPEPVMPLIQALLDSASSAALRDPRFPPVRPDELDRIVVEVTLLTPPEPIEVGRPEEYLDKVVVGRDGLIAQRGLYRGLLLPQVPVEWGWDVRTFIEHTCRKAGLDKEAWKGPGFTLYRFGGQVFAEREPHGEVAPKPLVV